MYSNHALVFAKEDATAIKELFDEVLETEDRPYVHLAADFINAYENAGECQAIELSRSNIQKLRKFLKSRFHEELYARFEKSTRGKIPERDMIRNYATYQRFYIDNANWHHCHTCGDKQNCKYLNEHANGISYNCPIWRESTDYEKRVHTDVHNRQFHGEAWYIEIDALSANLIETTLKLYPKLEPIDAETQLAFNHYTDSLQFHSETKRASVLLDEIDIPIISDRLNSLSEFARENHNELFDEDITAKVEISLKEQFDDAVKRSGYTPNQTEPDYTYYNVILNTDYARQIAAIVQAYLANNEDIYITTAYNKLVRALDNNTSDQIKLNLRWTDIQSIRTPLADYVFGEDMKPFDRAKFHVIRNLDQDKADLYSHFDAQIDASSTW